MILRCHMVNRIASIITVAEDFKIHNDVGLLSALFGDGSGLFKRRGNVLQGFETLPLTWGGAV